MRNFFNWSKAAVLAVLVILGSLLVPAGGWTQQAEYQRIVVLSDVHLPVIPREGATTERVQAIEAAKQKIIADINGWEDVTRVVVTGDIVGSYGTDDQYAYAKTYFGQINKSLSYIVGNHDYIYVGVTADGKFIRGNADERRAKLERFKREFNQQQLYYTQEYGHYLLVFLSVDSLDSKVLCEISSEQMLWLEGVLAGNRDRPTIIFFHAPLAGTLDGDDNKYVNTASFIAQPELGIKALLRKNPQVFMWVSGHTHTPATNKDFDSAINLYDGRVHEIHNSNLDRETIWTNSIYLYPDKVVVKTFQHRDQIWLDQLERTFTVK